ncbi:Catenin delta-1, partial [Varanus komodoensis]
MGNRASAPGFQATVFPAYPRKAGDKSTWMLFPGAAFQIQVFCSLPGFKDYPLGLNSLKWRGNRETALLFSPVCRSYEDMLVDDMARDQYYWAPLAQHERGSLASLDSLRKGGPGAANWRQPELPEVIAMLGFRLDAVKSNAAAYLQHLCYRNDKVKTEVRKLKGIPVLVGLLDHPKKEVHYGACGALKNISFGRDQDNKIAIKNCDGVPALVRLLRKARDMDLTEVITGTLWNLSSHDSIKMAIVDNALHALTDEVIIPRSGWEREPSEDSKPRHIEWESVLTNTIGCLRNVSSERSEARRKLRECDGLVDALICIVQAEIGQKDLDSKLVENCVCLLRNLSYQVHREIPHAERYQEAPLAAPNNTGPHAASCFGAKKGKDEWFARGKKTAEDTSADVVDFPKRQTPAKGYELLFQPEIVRIYISLLKESKTQAILEASAGAIQNLCAGRWTYGRYIRSALRQEKGLSAVADLLTHDSERVVKAASGALRNLAVDSRNKELIGKHAIPSLVKNLPGGQQMPVKNHSEDTVVSVLNTINEVIVENLEAAKKLRETQGIEKLVLINKSGPGYGTESALVALYDDLCREKDRGSASLLVLLDLSAAFDTTDHGILLDRLAGLGVGGTALQWFRSYLNGQFQKVVLGDCGSAPWQLCHGVPQGSILSPLLFNIYMKLLGEVIRRCGLRNHQYADDTQLYLSFSTNPGDAVAVLNRCLGEVMGWMRANRLKLNPDKMEVLLVGGSGFGEGGFDLVLNGVALPLRGKVCSLGVLLDPELSLEAQVTAVERSAFLQLRLINQLHPYLEYDCLATVTHALVTSGLDFCNALYMGLPLKMVRILQLVQNRAARNRSEREVRAAALVLQTIWGYKELRKPLEKEGWKKADFQVHPNTISRNQGGNSFDDSTLPLIDKNQKGDKKSSREEIQMGNMGPGELASPSSLFALGPCEFSLYQISLLISDNYSTLNEREHNRTLDRSGEEMESVKGAPLMQEEGQEFLEENDHLSYPPM